MKDVYAIIKSPVITEKATLLTASANKVVFWVDDSATKNEIKSAVQRLFNVKVADVNTHRAAGKPKRVGKTEGRTSLRKKAYVTLKKGEKIGLFEGK